MGALTESVTVTTEAALLKTDKADVSVNLKPADVVNLPLNQYRNYQGLMNLVPGATPTAFQNAQTDTPGRALTTNVNGTNRNNNVTRIDGAASINVWLPHHVGYVAPVETIETVNISTNSFDASQGMTGGAAVSVATKSGTNEIRGSAFYFRNQDEFNARQNVLLGGRQPAVVAWTSWAARSVARSRRTTCSTSAAGSATSRRTAVSRRFTVPTAKMRDGRLQRGPRGQPGIPAVRPRDRQPVDRRRPCGVRRRADSRQPHQLDRADDPGQYPLPNVPGTNNGTQNNYEVAPLPRGDARQLRLQGELEPHLGQPDLGQVLDDGRLGAGPVLHAVRPRPAAATPTVKLWSLGQTYTISPTLIWDATFGSNVMDHASQGPDFGTNYGLDVFGIPGTNNAGMTGVGFAGPVRGLLLGHAGHSTPASRCSATTPAGRR